MKRFKTSLLFLVVLSAFAIILTGCGGGGGGTTTVGGSGTTTAYCTPGNTYNYSSGKCCSNSTPYYYPGTHGIAAPGCYASCPYVGDCGTRFTKY